MSAEHSCHKRAQAKHQMSKNFAAEKVSLSSRRCTKRKTRAGTAFYLVRPSEVNLTTSSEYVRQSCTKSEKPYLSFLVLAAYVNKDTISKEL
jgi:hypothetical protein